METAESLLSQTDWPIILNIEIFSNLPAYDEMTTIHPYQDYPFSTLANTNQPILPEKTLHAIYADCLKYAIIGGYVGVGTTIWHREYIWHQMAVEAGYEDDYTQCTTYSLSTLQNYINNNIPLELSVQGDSCYSNHDLMITGYRQYWGVMDVATFVVPIQVIMVSVLPGNADYECWYDLTTLGTFGSYYTRAYSQKITPMILEDDL